MKNISIERQSQKLPLFDFSTKGFRGISEISINNVMLAHFVQL